MRPEPSTEPADNVRAAIAAHQHGELALAERMYRAALTIAPDHVEATHFLGLLLHQMGRSDEGLPLLQRAILLAPENHLFRGNLAGVLQQLGQSEEAERLYHNALNLNPRYVEGLVGLGMLYGARGDHLRALAAFARALQVDDRNYHAWLGRADSLLQLVRLPEALQAYRRAAEVAATADQLLGAALGLRNAGALEEAQYCHRRALELAPDNAAAENSLGNLLAVAGDLAAAETHYRRAIALRPDYASAYFNLTDVRRLGADDPLWPGLMELAAREAELPPEDAIPVHFALARIFESRQDYARGFSHFDAGNRRKRASIVYDEARQRRFFEDFARVFGPRFLEEHAIESADSRPVFIVGMPRSGTTLVEQILASHPAVHGAGEIHALRNALREELPPDNSDYALPLQLAGLDAAALRRVARRYSGFLDAVAPGAERVTNKLPGNIAFVGLMCLLYPRAAVIHVSRDPLDTCFSCYSKLFTAGHPFSYEQGELGRFYRMYEELMEHWRTVLPGRMLELCYEDLVGNVEVEARRLIAHLGLPWDEACLRFHESRREVRTASLAQVRRPIYTDSIGKWRHYEKELAPLRAALAGNP